MSGVATSRHVGHRPHAVRKATSDDVPVLARVLTRALERDPLVDWVVRQDQHRVRAIERLVGRDLLVRLALPLGEVYTTADRSGVALWLPPDGMRLPWSQRLRLLPALAAGSGSRRVVRAIRVQHHLDVLRPGEEHGWLLSVAVDPDHRGRGIGTALLRPMLDRCDERGLPAWLVATSRGNRGTFERLGFEVSDEVVASPGGPTLWPMRRPPRSVISGGSVVSDRSG